MQIITGYLTFIMVVTVIVSRVANQVTGRMAVLIDLVVGRVKNHLFHFCTRISVVIKVTKNLILFARLVRPDTPQGPLGNTCGNRESPRASTWRYGD